MILGLVCIAIQLAIFVRILCELQKLGRRVRNAIEENKIRKTANAIGLGETSLHNLAHVAQPKELERETLLRIVNAVRQSAFSDLLSSLPQDAYTLEETYFANIAYSWLIHGNSKRKAGNENYLLYWRIGVTVFEQHSAFMRLTHKPRPMLARRDNINLRKLCYLCAPADQVAKDWIRASWGLVQFYVKRGSDIKRLRFYDGDSYIHASLYFSVMMETTEPLAWTLAVIACRRKDQNRRDKKRNTALHLICCPPSRFQQRIHPELRKNLCQVMLGFGVGPNLKNKEGKTALDLLQTDDDFGTRSLLQKCTVSSAASQRHAVSQSNGSAEQISPSVPETLPAPSVPPARPPAVPPARPLAVPPARPPAVPPARPPAVPPARPTARPPAVPPARPPAVPPARPPAVPPARPPAVPPARPPAVPPARPPPPASVSSRMEAVQAEEPTSTDSSSLRPLARESVDIAAPKARGRKTAAAEKCASCSSFLDSAKKCFERNNGITEAFSKLVKVLSCPHPIQPKLNSQLVDDAMELMVNNLSTRICQTAEPSIRRRDIASVILDVSQSHLQQILKALAKLQCWEELKALTDRAGRLGKRTGSFASDISISGIIEDKKLKSSKEEVLRLLLDSGATIRNIQRSTVQSALNNDEFGVVGVLLDKGLNPQLLSPEDADRNFSPVHAAFRIASQKGDFNLFEKLYSWDQTESDAHRNTFLHLALQEQSSQYFSQVLDHLVSKGLVKDQMNDEGKMAVDYLTISNNDGAEKLIDLFVKGMETMTAGELRLATARQDTWLEDKQPEDMALKVKTQQIEAPRQLCENQENVEMTCKEDELDEVKFEGLPWEVVCYEKALKKLNSKDMPRDLKKKTFNIIKLLASGERRRKDFRQLKNAKPIRLFEANITRGNRLIWEIAIDFSPSHSTSDRFVYTDIIVVWDVVLDHDEILKSVQRIKNFRKWSSEASKRSLYNVVPDSTRRDDGLSRPCLYTRSDNRDTTDTAAGAHSEHQEQAAEDSGSGQPRSPLTADKDTAKGANSPASANDSAVDAIANDDEYQRPKYYNITSNLECSVLEATAVQKDFLLRVTQQEFEVIHLDFNAPVLLIGRSGTGKTVCCLHRLWNQFLESWKELFATPQDYAKTVPTTRGIKTLGNKVHRHQVFLTKNRELCNTVQRNFQELCNRDPVAIHHIALKKAQLPHRLQDVDEITFPLFLTSQQLLVMLDASLPGDRFFSESLRTSLHQPKTTITGEDTESYDDTADDDEEDDLAFKPKFSREHCPPKQTERREVTYELFAQQIWPKINRKMKADFHPSLVWMEIMSFIKGSFQALTMPGGFLDQQSYEDVGRKQAPNFTGNRVQVYALFERYREYMQKHGRHLYDEADVLFNIYNRLQRVRSQRSLPWVIDEVYVDETQDFTAAELFLLICLTEQPNRMFMAGDTAQSIARGVAFRFTDLKTLFYRAKEQRLSASHARLQIPTTIYQLTKNYRSHDGILRLAAGVLDLLSKLFPDSFDKLARDLGYFHGPKPVLLEFSNRHDLVSGLKGNQRETSEPIEFGADQVILVANDEARNDLPVQMEKALCLTIYEAKGLEFNDVLLYNFFKDSQAERGDWRVVSTFTDELLREGEGFSPSASDLVRLEQDAVRRPVRRFDENKHKILNSELKHLYTAVTRARAKVYIFDEDWEKRAPMFRYFKARDLAVSKPLEPDGDNTRPIFARRTSARKWEKRGDDMMKHRLFDQAVTCYRNANNTLKTTIAVSHVRAKAAAAVQCQPCANDSSGTAAMMLAFQKAAILFLESHAESVKRRRSPALRFYLATAGAAMCLAKGGKHAHAAQVFEKHGQLRKAAEQYEKAEMWSDARRCWDKYTTQTSGGPEMDEEGASTSGEHDEQ